MKVIEIHAKIIEIPFQLVGFLRIVEEYFMTQLAYAYCYWPPPSAQTRPCVYKYNLFDFLRLYDGGISVQSAERSVQIFTLLSRLVVVFFWKIIQLPEVTETRIN